MVEQEVGIKPNPKTLADKIANLLVDKRKRNCIFFCIILLRYLSTYIRGTFAGAFDEQALSPIPPQIRFASNVSGKIIFFYSKFKINFSI